MTALINELAAQPGRDEVLLVLDDYHLVDAGPVHESVAFLLENLPPGLLLAVSGRADPPLPLARLRARGQLAELRAAELRFTTEEAAALLGAAAGPVLPDTAVVALTARTEGWAAGLQLAALSLRGRTDAAGFVAAFSGSHRFVLDYLADEVLDGQPGQVRAFLLETSVLERLSGELWDAVTGRSGSQAMLHHIEQAGLFLVPLDEVRGWWRYHHLFADLLRARLEQEQPGRVQELHRAAAAWSDEHDLADDAVRHALAAGDAAWAARLVERHVETLLAAARARPCIAGFPRCPQSRYATVRACAWPRRPAPLSAAGWKRSRACWMTPSAPLRSAAMNRMSHRSARAVSVLANVPAVIAFLHAASRVFAVIQPSRPATTGRPWPIWAKGLGDALLRALEPGGRGLAARPAGQAERDLAEVLAERRAAGEGFLAIRVCYDLGQVQRAQGHLDAALATYRQALEIAGEGGSQPPHLGMAHVGLAEVLYERDELAAALDHATQGVSLCRQLALTPPLAAGLAVVARIRQAHGEAAAALEAMGEAGQAGLSPQVVALFSPVPSQRARLLLAQGDVHAAAQWTRRLASAQRTSRITPGSRRICCWRACCSPRTVPARHSRCCSGCWPPRRARVASATSSRFRRCGRWRWLPVAITPAPSVPWPRRSRWPARRATSGSLPTRALRCARC